MEQAKCAAIHRSVHEMLDSSSFFLGFSFFKYLFIYLTSYIFLFLFPILYSSLEFLPGLSFSRLLSLLMPPSPFVSLISPLPIFIISTSLAVSPSQHSLFLTRSPFRNLSLPLPFSLSFAPRPNLPYRETTSTYL